jgi:hypothetical protein
MSAEQVNQILGRALLDKEFLGQLLNDPDSALQAFDLTAQEIETLKNVSAEQFQVLDETFRTHLGGAEADPSQASNFMKYAKIETFVDLNPDEMIPGRLKWIPETDVSDQATNAWPSKLVPTSPAAATGISLLPILAIGVVVIGALAAGFFLFGGTNRPEEAEAVPQAVSSEQPELPENEDLITEILSLEKNTDTICLLGNEVHLCAAPAGQVIEQIGDTANDPLMLPLTPEQAALLISASGGTPPGVTGFTVMMLAGPETYRIQLPDSSKGKTAAFLTDTLGSLYFGSATYFSEKTLAANLDTNGEPAGNALSSLAGIWENISGSGTMTCNGSSINIPPEPGNQVEFDENGQGVLSEVQAESSNIEITTSSDGTFLAMVTTVVDGNSFIGQLEFSLVTPDLIEGTYTATYEELCTFERSVTMHRISSTGSEGEGNLAPLKPAEFSVGNYFGPGDTFIPQFESCIAFPDVCKDELTFLESVEALSSGWGTFGGDVFLHGGGGGGAGKVNISQNCATNDSGQTETACIPSPEQGDAYIPPYPADAGWGSKGIGNPTLVSILDVNAASAINGIYDLWMVTGIPQHDQWDGFIDINSELMQVYTLNLVTGQQELWEEIKVTYDTVDIATDQNRIFVLYLFEDQAAAQSASPTYP